MHVEQSCTPPCSQSYPLGRVHTSQQPRVQQDAWRAGSASLNTWGHFEKAFEPFREVWAVKWPVSVYVPWEWLCILVLSHVCVVVLVHHMTVCASCCACMCAMCCMPCEHVCLYVHIVLCACEDMCQMYVSTLWHLNVCACAHEVCVCILHMCTFVLCKCIQVHLKCVHVWVMYMCALCCVYMCIVHIFAYVYACLPHGCMSYVHVCPCASCVSQVYLH